MGNMNLYPLGGHGGCLKTNVKYSPLDFPGARRSMETSAEACKARCKSHPECGHFSFWAKELPDDNGCTLFGASAVFGHTRVTNDIITGPATCSGEIEILLLSEFGSYMNRTRFKKPGNQLKSIHKHN